MRSKATTVDDYIREQAKDRVAALNTLRETINQSVPSAVECMRYGMPSYEMGELLCAFAAQKHYFSVYIMDTTLMNQYLPVLGKLSVGKGCIRFRKIEDLPLDVVGGLLKEAGRRREAGITTAPCDDA